MWTGLFKDGGNLLGGLRSGMLSQGCRRAEFATSHVLWGDCGVTTYGE
jgi:hypothetical protein